MHIIKKKNNNKHKLVRENEMIIIMMVIRRGAVQLGKIQPKRILLFKEVTFIFLFMKKVKKVAVGLPLTSLMSHARYSPLYDP